MKAVILAAGIGYRLLPYTKLIPKALVKVNSKPILQYIMDGLIVNGIKSFIIVIGYKKDEIVEFIRKNYRDIEVRFVENKIYSKTNNIYSLWLASKYVDDDILLVESDIVFEPKLIEKLLMYEEKNVVALDKFKKGMDGTVVELNSYNEITNFFTKEFQKKLDCFDSYYKTVNVYKFSFEFLKKHFFPMLELYIKTQPLSKYYEIILKLLSFLEFSKLKGLFVGDVKWWEVDTIEDLKVAEYMFSSSSRRYEILSKSFGGLWSYSVNDFSFMTNPFFPPEEFFISFKERCYELTKGYSSSQVILEEKAASIINIPKEFIVLVNGISQVIKLISKFRNYTFGVINPTFGEFFIFKKHVKINVIPERNYNVEVERIIELLEIGKINALVIVNPNNPTGQIIKKEDIEKLLQNKALKLLLLDESFMDFSEINETLLDKIYDYGNLVILKSLGKSMGIPGMRLGLVITSNKKFINRVRASLPIWNINSFGEFFISQFPKIRGAYIDSLKEIIKERKNFHRKINSLSFLKSYPTYTNFLFVEILPTSNYSAREIAHKLIDKNIFVKDITDKFKEISNNQKGYLRIAVKTPLENEMFVKVLRDIYER